MNNDSASPQGQDTGERGSDCEHDWEAIASTFTGYGSWNIQTGRVETVRIEKTATRQVCILCGAIKNEANQP